MHYLKIQKGIFIASKKNNVDFIKEKAKRQKSIDLIVIIDMADSKSVLSAIMLEIDVDENDIAHWRYSYRIEHNLVKRLVEQKKCFKASSDYYHERLLAACVERMLNMLSGVFSTMPAS